MDEAGGWGGVRPQGSGYGVRVGGWWYAWVAWGVGAPAVIQVCFPDSLPGGAIHRLVVLQVPLNYQLSPLAFKHLKSGGILEAGLTGTGMGLHNNVEG